MDRAIQASIYKVIDAIDEFDESKDFDLQKKILQILMECCEGRDQVFCEEAHKQIELAKELFGVSIRIEKSRTAQEQLARS